MSGYPPASVPQNPLTGQSSFAIRPAPSVLEPEEENQRPSKMSRFESYDRVFRPGLHVQPLEPSLDQSEPEHSTFNGLPLNMRAMEEMGWANNGAIENTPRNGSVMMSREESTGGLPSQSSQVIENSNTEGAQSRIANPQNSRSPCCKRSKKQASQSSPEVLVDTMDYPTLFSSAPSMELEIATGQQSNPMETSTLFGDAKGQVESPFQSEFTFQAPSAPYTTSYNSSSPFATTMGPLSSEDEALVLQNHELQPQAVAQYISTGLTGTAAPSAEGDNGFSLMQSCLCGPGCKCLYCTEHPYNSTTRDRVETLAELLPFDDVDHSPQSRPQSSYGGSMGRTSEDSGPRIGFSDPNGLESSLVSSTMQPTPISQPGPGSNEFQAISFGSLDQAQSPTVPSSRYFTMAYDYSIGALDRCTSGDCRCGTHCICVGCLTHTGHNGQVFSES